MPSMVLGEALFWFFWSHNALTGHIFLNLTLQIFCLYIMVSSFVFLWDFSVCECICLCVNMCFLDFLFAPPPFICFVFSGLFNFILFFSFFLDACLYSNEREKEQAWI